MSALLPATGPLPAAVALAIAAASPHGAQAEHGAALARAPGASLPDHLKAIRESLDAPTLQLLHWVAMLQTSLEDASETFADITQLVRSRVARLDAGVRLASNWAQLRIDEMEGLTGDLGSSAAHAIGAGRLTAFALRAGARMPGSMTPAAREGAEAVVHAALQPLYDAVGSFRVIEARLVISAKRAALKADIQALAIRHIETIKLAKAEVVRVVAETAKLAFAEIPPRQVRAIAREAVVAIPVEARGPKPFGRRIDYPGIANRWITGP